MWLKGGDDAPARKRAACRSQRRTNLGRMMSVIVDDGDALRLAQPLEATLRSRERREPARQRVKVRAERKSCGNRGERVQDVVLSRHDQLHAPQLLVVIHDIESTPQTTRPNTRRDKPRVR